jgi:phosphomannomutase / phosphoglucomutase
MSAQQGHHYFFNKPFGRGYDDGLVSAIAICDMMDRNPGKKMSSHCDDEKKYGIVEQVVKHFRAAKQKGDKVAGQPIRDLVTVNGVRVTVKDGTWGLVRASSNKPELVVMVESPASEARMREMFKAVDSVLRTHPEVGAYNQTI